MSDLLFKCPACSKSLAVSELGIGKIFPCPDCQNRITAPEPALYFECPSCNGDLCAPGELAESEFQCPNCNATIQVPAIGVPERRWPARAPRGNP